MKESINSEIKNTDPKNFISIGGKVDKARVSLRFFGDDLNPDEVTHLLDCQPTEAHKKDDVVPSKFNPRIVKTGTWLLSFSKKSEEDLEGQISQLLDQLPKNLEIWQNLTRRFDSDIYCGAWLKAWNRDVWLSAGLLSKLSDRGLNLGMAIYCDGEDDEEEE